MPTALAWEIIGRWGNTLTKVSRYNASGTTHNNDATATSAEMWLLTPSKRLDGRNANTTHQAFVFPETDDTVGGETETRPRRARQPQTPIRPTSST